MRYKNCIRGNTMSGIVPSQTSTFQTTNRKSHKDRDNFFGFQSKGGYTGWDELQANISQSKLFDLIIVLRSQTLGIATSGWSFDNMAKPTVRVADDLFEQHRAAAE